SLQQRGAGPALFGALAELALREEAARELAGAPPLAERREQDGSREIGAALDRDARDLRREDEVAGARRFALARRSERLDRRAHAIDARLVGLAAQELGGDRRAHVDVLGAHLVREVEL